MNINNSCALIFLGAQPIFSFYCDYFYQSSGITYTFRGGYSDNGLDCGFTSVALYRASSYASWSIDAALSFKLSI